MVRAKNGTVAPSVLEALRDAERLVVAALTGTPLKCELDHAKGQAPEATTMLALGIASCESHGRGE